MLELLSFSRISFFDTWLRSCALIDVNPSSCIESLCSWHTMDFSRAMTTLCSASGRQESNEREPSQGREINFPAATMVIFHYQSLCSPCNRVDFQTRGSTQMEMEMGFLILQIWHLQVLLALDGDEFEATSKRVSRQRWSLQSRENLFLLLRAYWRKQTSFSLIFHRREEEDVLRPKYLKACWW